jgi:transmembrane sensor
MEDILWNCIIKRLTDSETHESKLRLDSWLAEDASHIKQYEEARLLWNLNGQLKASVPKIQFKDLLNQHQDIPDKKVIRLSAFWKYSIAASLALLLLVAVLSRSYNSNTKNEQVQEWVVKKADHGQITLVNMPDSSKIWLNSGTQIRYAKHFNKAKTRLIILTGEAYFDVHHDPSHPFVVKSTQLTTTVYGTSFNVRAYGNEEETSVIVNSGKVGVIPMKKNAEATMLLPQDKLVYAKGELLKSITNAQANSWLKGDIVFDQTPLPEVFKAISRKFNVNIKADASHYRYCKLTARFSNKPLSDVLKALKMSMNIRSIQKGTTIYLEGGTACSSHTK